MSDKTKNIIAYGALTLGALGSIYALTQPKPTLSPKDSKDIKIATMSVLILGIGAGAILWKSTASE